MLQIIYHYMVVNNVAPRSSGKTLIATQFVFLPHKERLSLSISQNKQPPPRYYNFMILSWYALHSNISLCGFARGKRIFCFKAHILTQNSEC